MKAYFLSTFLLLCFISIKSTAQTFTIGATTLESRVISQDLKNPWDLVWGPDNEIWFTTKYGYIMKVNPESLDQDTIHFITETFVSTLENSGLHALGLHPNFPETPYLYTHYTYDTLSAKLVRWRYDEISQTLTDSMHIIPYMPGARSHNGSRIEWDTDSTFLLTTGDAYLFEIAQDSNSYNGKILRFKDDGTIPSDNPIIGSSVFALGFRNPQGLAILPNGEIFTSEHGPSEDDEINHILPATNYGWPNVSGYCDSTDEISFCNNYNVKEPLYTWTPTYAICGMAWYDHPQIPEIRESLLLTSLKAKRILYLPLDLNNNTIDTFHVLAAESFKRLRDVLVAPNGNIYLATSNHENFMPSMNPNDDKIIELYNPNYIAGMSELNTESKLYLYPNPAMDELNIEGNFLKHGGFIEVFDLSGKIRLTQTSTSSISSIDISRLNKGLYFIHVTNGKNKLTRKFIKK